MERLPRSNEQESTDVSTKPLVWLVMCLYLVLEGQPSILLAVPVLVVTHGGLLWKGVVPLFHPPHGTVLCGGVRALEFKKRRRHVRH